MAFLFPPVPGLQAQPKINFGTDATPELNKFYNGVFDFFKNSHYTTLVSDLKIAAFIVSVICGLILIFILYKMRGLVKEEFLELKGELKPPSEAGSAFDARWREIKNHANSFKESEWKFAVIEADKFVDDVLKSAGFRGETMGERLTIIKPDELLNLQYLWDAHKLRNLVAHDPNFRLTHQQVLWAIEAFESVLRELGALT